MNSYEIAMDLILEDLQKMHSDIRQLAKEYGCEHELEEIKVDLINYLQEKRNTM